MFQIKAKIKLLLLKIKYMLVHPMVVPMNYFDPKLVNIGNCSYGELNVVSFNDSSKLRIGSFVSIAQKVTFLLDAEHSIGTLSSYPFRAKLINNTAFLIAPLS